MDRNKKITLEIFFPIFAPNYIIMDAIWYGIADFFEFIFKIAKPIGMNINLLFVFLGSVGIIYWLWYTIKVKKGSQNYLSFPPKSK